MKQTNVMYLPCDAPRTPLHWYPCQRCKTWILIMRKMTNPNWGILHKINGLCSKLSMSWKTQAEKYFRLKENREDNWIQCVIPDWEENWHKNIETNGEMWIWCNTNITFPDFNNYMQLCKKMSLFLENTLKYLGENGHEDCNIFPHGSEDTVRWCIHIQIQIQTEQLGRCGKMITGRSGWRI